ncbi:MAG: hypothetical protein JXA11_09955 [Phycisphaerae bacterium]|nr:hypothetical protein [Phycisphaerae bacterium]
MAERDLLDILVHLASVKPGDRENLYVAHVLKYNICASAPTLLEAVQNAIDLAVAYQQRVREYQGDSICIVDDYLLRAFAVASTISWENEEDPVCVHVKATLKAKDAAMRDLVVVRDVSEMQVQDDSILDVMDIFSQEPLPA